MERLPFLCLLLQQLNVLSSFTNAFSSIIEGIIGLFFSLFSIGHLIASTMDGWVIHVIVATEAKETVSS
jgi:hypothetical protein